MSDEIKRRYSIELFLEKPPRRPKIEYPPGENGYTYLSREDQLIRSLLNQQFAGCDLIMQDEGVSFYDIGFLHWNMVGTSIGTNAKACTISPIVFPKEHRYQNLKRSRKLLEILVERESSTNNRKLVIQKRPLPLLKREIEEAT